MSDLDDRKLLISEICKFLGHSNDAMYSGLINMKCPTTVMSCLWKFKKDEVDTWLKAGGSAEHYK
ncbi:AlpA family transcriptional regulator [Nitrosomonas nitrosa]|nr:AlpA family transcriptional regulator [Nitrosomonas nitrosa]